MTVTLESIPEKRMKDCLKQNKTIIMKGQSNDNLEARLRSLLGIDGGKPIKYLMVM